MKKNSIQTTLCYFFQAFDQKNHGINTLEHFFGPLSLPWLHPTLVNVDSSSLSVLTT